MRAVRAIQSCVHTAELDSESLPDGSTIRQRHLEQTKNGQCMASGFVSVDSLSPLNAFRASAARRAVSMLMLT